MRQLTIEIPELLAQRLAWLATEQKKSVEQVALERLASLLEPPAEALKEKYDWFFKESGLFVEAPNESRRLKSVL